MAICLGTARVAIIRISRLDDSCGCVVGPNNAVVTSAIISLQATPEYEPGDDLVQKNGDGVICLSLKTPDQLKRMTLNLSLCTRNPETLELLTGATVLTNDEGEIVGIGRLGIGESAPDPVAIEIWTRAISQSGNCNTAEANWWRWIYPYTQWTLGEVTHEAGLGTVTLTGFGEANPNYVYGCFDDWPTLSPDPFPATSPEVMILDPDGPPTASCGYVTVPSS